MDPDDPFSQIIVSPHPDNQTIMSNAPCGTPPVLCDAAFLTSLQPDDLGGLRVLYLIPEPGIGALVAFAASALVARRKQTRRGQAGHTTD